MFPIRAMHNFFRQYLVIIQLKFFNTLCLLNIISKLISKRAYLIVAYLNNLSLRWWWYWEYLNYLEIVLLQRLVLTDVFLIGFSESPCYCSASTFAMPLVLSCKKTTKCFRARTHRLGICNPPRYRDVYYIYNSVGFFLWESLSQFSISLICQLALIHSYLYFQPYSNRLPRTPSALMFLLTVSSDYGSRGRRASPIRGFA